MMFKKIATFLVVAIISIQTTCVAECSCIDMNDEELLQHRFTLDKKYFEKHPESGYVLPAGVYKIGESIPGGAYEIVDFDYDIIFYVAKNQLDFAGYETRAEYRVYKEADSFSVYLDDGFAVYFNAPVTLRPFLPEIK